jgi:hypothetical protein
MNSGMYIIDGDLTPPEFYLGQNYPNPFCEKTTIKYCVAYKTWIRIIVFNPEGKIIKKLVDEEKNAGTYELEFNAYDLTSGVYSYQLRAGNFSQTKKLLLTK